MNGGKDPLRSNTFFAAPSRSALENRLEQFAQIVLDRMADAAPAPFPEEVDPVEIERHFLAPFPLDPEPLDEILSHVRSHVVPHCSNKRAPRYFAQMDVPPTDLSVFSGLLIRALAQDPIAYSSSRSGTFVERQVARWLCSQVYLSQESADGAMTSGGSQSNFQALLLLRNRAFRRFGLDVSSMGLAEATTAAQATGVVFLVSEVAHQSIFSALRFIGLGDHGALVVRVDEDERMRLDDLREKLAWARMRKLIVAGVVLTAATTGCGAVDPLAHAIGIAHGFEVPVHVDAAHGGMLLLSERYRPLLCGIEEADSVTVDPHKILGLNQSLGFLAVRDADLLDELGKIELQYYRQEQVPDLGDRTVDNSRSLNSLGAWVLIRATGRRGYAAMVDHLMVLSETFRARIRAHSCFQMLCDAPMNVVAFRPLINRDGTLEERNRCAEKLLFDVLAGGDFAISRYTRRDGETLLRAVFVNPASTTSDVHALASRVTRVAESYASTPQFHTRPPILSAGA